METVLNTSGRHLSLILTSGQWTSSTCAMIKSKGLFKHEIQTRRCILVDPAFQFENIDERKHHIETL